MRRRLAAILYADVVGYSRLMGEDEAATLRTLRAYQAVFGEHVERHGGRIVDAPGDALLAEFTSAVEVVTCAGETQRAIAGRNEELSDDRRMHYRIGVNLGEIVEDGGSLYGEGVNVAARMEALAEVGGICISGKVFDEVEGKVDGAFDFLGEKQVKNIARPVPAYRLRDAAEVAPQDDIEAPTPAVPATADKPSIAVLPFDNMSGDTEQDYFVDGITEDIITAISRVRWLFVIARHSSFAYKGSSAGPQGIAAEFGVRYLLGGSVRKAGDRVRITAELIEGASGEHLWAKRFDREIGDIFALPDEVTAAIVGEIEPEMSKVERFRARAKAPENLDAWDVFQRGLARLYRYTKEDVAAAQRLFDRACEMDPELGLAHVGLAEACYYAVVYELADSPDECRETALSAAQRAVELDGEDAAAHCALGWAHYLGHQPDRAVSELETAIELNPSFALAHYSLGAALVFSGRAAEALSHLEMAMRLSPHDPNMGSFLVRIADAHLFLRQDEDAAAWAKKALRQPGFQWSRHAVLISALGHFGRAAEAAAALDEVLRQRPDFSRDFVAKTHLIGDEGDMSRYLDGLARAGVAA